ncbi:hypothetical protein ACFQ3P_01310 [Paraburkholderia sabiae]|jgi:hypothetical protein|uniref:Uncharacterized protein n=1 Tax=Paraburkholderia sabiae TaxID=273251 RepID=A0ABU9Q9W1_9BURK|nr:hypothetical protein [Paraburkholderia sabiae]WJZ78520.1 hypothetical protein QEN71_31525 [Paraburkholderia sabiae]
MFVWLRDGAAESRSAYPHFAARDHKEQALVWQPETRRTQSSVFIIGATKISGADVRSGK